MPAFRSVLVLAPFTAQASAFVCDGGICDDHVALLAQKSKLSAGSFVASSLDNCMASAESMTFEDFSRIHSRDYIEGTDEYESRRSLFEARQLEVQRHNCDPERSWSAAVNHLSDHTEDERNQLLGWKGHGAERPASMSLLQEVSFMEPSAETLLPVVNWNVSVVQRGFDQKSCGSCWAVATRNMLYAFMEIQGLDDQLSLAVQDFVDCVPNPRQCGGTGGCGGATVELALDYFASNPLNRDQGNTYLGRENKVKQCRPKSGGITMADIKLGGYQTLPKNRVEPVLLALQRAPVAVALEATGKWFHYGSGIVDGCNKDSTTINHAVLLTGYGQDKIKGKKKNFWRILNSWGARWGERGSIRMVMADTSADEEANCAMDKKPQDGVDCKDGPKEVKVCGTCGILYDVVSLNPVKESKAKLILGKDGLPDKL